MFEMAWRNDSPDLDAWVANYAQHRYGQSNEHSRRAWRGLLNSVYQRPARGGSVISQLPSVSGGHGGAAGHMTQLAEAWQSLLEAADQLSDVDTYRYDLVNVARQALAQPAAVLHQEVVAAWQARDTEAFGRASDRFLQLMADLDELLATRPEFLLGRWLEDAKRWGTTEAEQARYEWNARRVLTLWGQGPAIDDYACRQWSGMINGYYRPRWERLFHGPTRSLQRDDSAG